MSRRYSACGGRPAVGASCAPGVLAVLVVPAVLATLGVVPPSALAEEFQEHFTVQEKSFRIDDLIGEIRIEGTDGPAFEIDVNVQGADASRDKITIERRDGETPRLVVEFPLEKESHFVYPRLGRGSHTTFSWGHEPGEHKSLWREIFNLGPGKRVTISGSGSGQEMWADVTVKVPRDRKLDVRLGVGNLTAADVAADLKLDTASGPVQAEGITGSLSVDTGSGAVDLKRIKGETTVDTGSGHVSVADVEGNLNLDTGSGRVSVTRAKGSKTLADTGSGGVTLSDVACEDLYVDTGSGGIEADGVSTDGATFDTGSGGVDVAFTRLGTGRVEIDTGSGGVTLLLPPDPSATIEASTGSGGVDVQLTDVEWIRKTRRETAFRVGGGETRILIDTGSGSVRIGT
jgi:lia operon protein LiaG